MDWPKIPVMDDPIAAPPDRATAPEPPDGVPADELLAARMADPLALRFQALMRASDLVSRGMARHLGVNMTDLAALNHLMDAEPRGPAELGGLLDLSSASVTALTQRLEAMGHLTRRPHPSDRRRLVVEPTEHARTEAWLLLRPLLTSLQAASDDLAPEERAAVERWLLAATEAFRAYARELAAAGPGSEPAAGSTTG